MPLKHDLLKIASKLPAGDPTRRKILAALKGRPTAPPRVEFTRPKTHAGLKVIYAFAPEWETDMNSRKVGIHQQEKGEDLWTIQAEIREKLKYRTVMIDDNLPLRDAKRLAAEWLKFNPPRIELLAAKTAAVRINDAKGALAEIERIHGMLRRTSAGLNDLHDAANDLHELTGYHPQLREWWGDDAVDQMLELNRQMMRVQGEGRKLDDKLAPFKDRLWYYYLQMKLHR